MAKLMLFTGKGGVGKSTTSAATALYFAQQGYKTLLVSSDPAHSTQDVLGVEVKFTPTPIVENLWAKNLNAQQQAQEFFDELHKNVKGSFSKAVPFFDAEILTDWANFPGMDEVFALEEIQSLVQSVEYDIIVFDTAPTGHTLKALTAPDAMNTFLLRILRMKAKIERMKTFLLKPSDTSKMVKLIEETSQKLNNVKKILRNKDFVSINLVSIATEAGYEECNRTIQFLKAQEFTVNNVIINGLIPSFGEDTWAEAKTNKAVALVKMEHDLQQPYIAQYKNLTKKEGCRLLGVSKLPFEPKGARLLEFARFIWKEKGLEFAAEKSIVVEEGDDKIKLKLFFPYDETLVLEDDGYVVDGFFKHDIYCRNPELKGKKIIRKQKNKDGATYTFEV
jgi:TRC40/GET3/ArsA family transport-energizing ATPase